MRRRRSATAARMATSRPAAVFHRVDNLVSELDEVTTEPQPRRRLTDFLADVTRPRRNRPSAPADVQGDLEGGDRLRPEEQDTRRWAVTGFARRRTLGLPSLRSPAARTQKWGELTGLAFTPTCWTNGRRYLRPSSASAVISPLSAGTLVITAPASQWRPGRPDRSADRTRSVIAAASADKGSKRVGGGDHSVCGGEQWVDHAVQLPDSANAPWTSMMAGLIVSSCL
jgi:hypothetical protein